MALHQEFKGGQCGRVGDDGGADGDGNRSGLGQAQALHHRVGQQRVWRPADGQQDRGGGGEPQGQVDRDGHCERDDEGECAEGQRLGSPLPEFLQVQLQPCLEHEVQQSGVAEHLHGALSLQQAQCRGPNQDACADESDDRRHAHGPGRKWGDQHQDKQQR